MPYTVYLKRSAEKELAELPARAHDRIIKALLSLKDDPFSRNAKKLHGRIPAPPLFTPTPNASVCMQSGTTEGSLGKERQGKMRRTGVVRSVGKRAKGEAGSGKTRHDG